MSSQQVDREPVVYTDVRDEINAYLKKEQRPLKWVSNNTTLKYGTLYSIFVHKVIKIGEERLAVINQFLGTDFKEYYAEK